MEQSQWEVVILKPTYVFRSFLEAQLPDIEIPELDKLQRDSTAYTIKKHDCEEASLDELERNYAMMFRHEVSRWLGQEAAENLKASFLDFLCCFKFEMHSQIVLMEPTLSEGHQLVCIKPRAVLMKWMKEQVKEEVDLLQLLDQVNVTNISENATVVVKNFDQLNEIKPFLQDCYNPVYQHELSRMCDDSACWPKINNFQDFSRYFAVELHTQLVHLH
tara:strand:- start:1372 stop:2025 length:654 start_codon:yes stop_codon:yes gene_type:complete